MSTPINNLEGLVLEALLDLFEAWHGAVLQKVHAPVDSHEEKAMVLEHFLMTFSIHCHVWWKEKDPDTSTGTSKECRHHQAG
jgi:hypothetical protein